MPGQNLDNYDGLIENVLNAAANAPEPPHPEPVAYYDPAFVNAAQAQMNAMYDRVLFNQYPPWNNNPIGNAVGHINTPPVHNIADPVQYVRYEEPLATTQLPIELSDSTIEKIAQRMILLLEERDQE